ncbi:hypothetical protein N7532_009210 [Penicillium argentinense]|uniref:Uncharacterized protein n=1 Tax=Penicillium argentinense TaxID=1131581 RepID=A0A9W9K2R9_9EURO|nr:uncharacterized protein N7532_009210 [Penicillium argentinense]KAJ5090526.1 hypothetical protein N7532_009210 [Penicillium argentinense]
MPNPPINRVMEYLETALNENLPQITSNLVVLFFVVGYNLGRIYYNKAQEDKLAGDRELAMSYLRKIVDIVPEQLPEWQLLPPRMFAARYYHQEGDDEAAGREACPSRQLALEPLSDDDEGNELSAFWHILFSTIPFGDEKNATAALAMIGKTFNAWPPFEEALLFELECDDNCGHVWKDPGDMGWCKY